MHVDRQLLSEHATRVGDALLPVDRKADRDRMDQFPLFAVADSIGWCCVVFAHCVGLLENSKQVRFVDLLAADIDVHTEYFGMGCAGAEIDRDRTDGFLCDVLGHMYGLADRVFRRIHVDDCTIAHAAADLVACPNHARL